MTLQQFGNIDTADESANAMLCMDIDRPDEAMLHWWGEKTAPGGALVRFLRANDGAVELEPIAAYRSNDNGGLWLPKLLEAEIEYLRGFHGSLQEKDGLLEGEWTHRSGKSGRIIFRPPERSANVVPEKCANWSEFKEWASRARDE